MKVAVLTFQFAHNYGALLQAYALKSYLQEQVDEVDIIPFYPEWAQKEYEISPFAGGISLKKRVKRVLQYVKRKKQNDLFEQFKQEELELKETFSSENTLEEQLNSYDTVVYGSDQIWNDKITGPTDAYFGKNSTTHRIAYAASIGTGKLTDVQKKNLQNQLKKFKSVSVREVQSQKLIEAFSKTKVEVVMDPVFLLKRSNWMQHESSVKVEKPFMLVYLLREDAQLLNIALRYAEENNLCVYEIHPTLARSHEKCTLLKNVGPREFLWLIENASCVCSNSFHATAFSTIYKKKLFHIPSRQSPERTVSLLMRLGMTIKDADKELPMYDFEQVNEAAIEKLAEQSKKFLDTALKEG